MKGSPSSAIGFSWRKQDTRQSRLKGQDMELKGKERAFLRAMANSLDTLLFIGKDGITANTLKEAYDLLQARELVKCTVQQSAPLSAREACDQLCEKTGASPVQVIGRRFTVYRRNDKESKIKLP
jgi:RNA-binding protein